MDQCKTESVLYYIHLYIIMYRDNYFAGGCSTSTKVLSLPSTSLWQITLVMSLIRMKN